jgi:hypothetical protein
MSSHPLPQARVVRTAGQLVASLPVPSSQEPSRLGALCGRLLASAARVDYRGRLRVAYNHAIDLRRPTSLVVLLFALLLLPAVVRHCIGPQYASSHCNSAQDNSPR